MDSGGWVPLHALAQGFGVDVDLLVFCVVRNEKARFQISAVYEQYQPNEAQFVNYHGIRAVQGHSRSLECPLDDNRIFEVLTQTEIRNLPRLLHVSFKAALKDILKNGIIRMQRQHAHLTTEDPTSIKVISGIRSGANIIFILTSSL